MNELSQTVRQLPETIEEKTKYVLFGMEALKIYRAKLKAMEKAGISKEQYDQLKMEAQETAENLLLFSADIGNEMQKIEKASGGDRRSENFKNVGNHSFEKSKATTIKEMGFTENQARSFQTLANHPDEVQDAIKSAREHGEIVTRSDVFKRITDQYDRRKREARELSEAKKRADSFEEKKSEGVVEFSEIKQNKADNSLIFREFENDVSKMYMTILSVSGSVERDTTMNAIKAADTKKLDEINKDLMDCYRCILKIQKTIVEVIDEK